MAKKHGIMVMQAGWQKPQWIAIDDIRHIVPKGDDSALIEFKTISAIHHGNEYRTYEYACMEVYHSVDELARMID